MKNRFALYSAAMVAALTLPTLLVLVYNVHIDPFQILHRDNERPSVLLGGRGTDRYQHAGTINSMRFQSIVLGNSHSANYLPSTIEKNLNSGKTVSLTMDGATIAEQFFPASHALRKQNIDTILWGVSPTGLLDKHDGRNLRMTLPEFLYDDEWFNDLQLFLTFDLRKYHLEKNERKEQIRRSDDPEKNEREGLDQSTAWYWANKKHFGRPLFVAKKILRKKKLTYSQRQIQRLAPLPHRTFMGGEQLFSPGTRKRLLQSEENVRKNIRPLIVSNPGVRFNFVVTAYPTLRLQVDKLFRKDYYLANLLVQKQFVEAMSAFPNVRIFAFGLENFPDNLRLYKDPGHYHIEVNDYITEGIAAGKNILNTANIDAYLEALDKKISSYRLHQDWNPQGKKRISPRGKEISKRKARALLQWQAAADS